MTSDDAILVTFPGRAGDIFWALPTLRALSQYIGAPVDLQICGEFAALIPVLLRQPYLQQIVADPGWSMSDGWQAPALQNSSEVVLHLGYRRWPELPLPYETQYTLRTYYPGYGIESIDLKTPWITNLSRASASPTWICAFTETHFELKYGLWELLTRPPQGIFNAGFLHRPLPLSLSSGSRWQNEAGHCGADWLTGASWIANAPLVLADNSGWHVLAVAMGVPVVMVEPMEARWNKIFFPLGWDGPQVTMVLGNDGKPTFDSRHVAEAIQTKLTHIRIRAQAHLKESL